MILLDTSVVVDALHPRNADLRERFAKLQGVICGITRAEVLQGARDPVEAEELRAALNAYPQVPTPEGVWDMLGRHLAILRGAGRKVPLADAMIATLAIYHGIELWTRNGHHDTFRAFIPALRLFEEREEQQT